MGPYNQTYMNPYQMIQKEAEQANSLTGQRERVRNIFIDKTGRKPSEKEIDAIMAMSLDAGGSSPQQSSTLLQPQSPPTANTMLRAV